MLFTPMAAQLNVPPPVLELFDPELAPDQPVRLPLSVAPSITENRLGPLLEKHRFAVLARRITDDLGTCETGPVGPDLTRGIGMMSRWTPGPDRCRFGWQVQAEQFRLVAITPGRLDKAQA